MSERYSPTLEELHVLLHPPPPPPSPPQHCKRCGGLLHYSAPDATVFHEDGNYFCADTHAENERKRTEADKRIKIRRAGSMWLVKWGQRGGDLFWSWEDARQAVVARSRYE